MQGARIEATVRIGLQDDFAEHLLSDVLRRFSRVHPLVSLEVSIARNAELLSRIENGRLDLALAWEAGASTPHATRLGETQMHWIGSRELPAPSPADNLPLPLVVFDAPCILRSAATKALDQARIPWRVVLTSPSVSGIWAAVSAGLGITLRTRIGLPPQLALIESLPALPMLGYVLHQAVAAPTAAVRQLSELIQASLAELR
ncbi:hypothetical protein GC387_13230 [Pseudomonas sp. MWU12-2323]|nr:hypothetical protein [Pseudomonas sp. MWU12-2323]